MMHAVNPFYAARQVYRPVAETVPAGATRRVIGPATLYSSLDSARTAALEHLLQAWHTPFPSEPESVKLELTEMRAQVEVRLRQPSLF